jgi:hypothetical protein
VSDYSVARRALLDALDALGNQRDAVILCGAQAVYLHAGEGDFAVAPTTFDADLMLDPALIHEEPLIRSLMEAAHFKLSGQPGLWKSAEGIAVDLLVAESLGGGGKRGARLGEHGNDIARKVKGLEAAVVDRSETLIRSLDVDDTRSFEVAVAGPAALIVAKTHKIAERVGGPATRLKNKDALDILRLLRATETMDVAATLTMLMANELAGPVTTEAIRHFERLFTGETAEGVSMAVAATAGLEDPANIAVSMTVLARELMEAIGGLARPS